MTAKVDFVLIHPPYHRRRGSGCVFPIGLGYLASAAESRGYTVEIIDCAPVFASLQPDSLGGLRSWLANRLSAARPRLAIGIGPCTTSAVRGILAVAQVCKDVFPGIPLIYGGPLASLPGQAHLFFEQFSATAVVPGDGEAALCDILVALSDGGDLSRLANITTQSRVACTNIIVDLDALPFPRRQWDAEGPGYVLSVRRDLNAGEFATMIKSRGCPHRCRFCVSRHLRDGKYSTRSLGNVATEILHLQSFYSVRNIVFYDDTFFLRPGSLAQDVAELSESLGRLPNQVVWQAEMRPDVLVAIDKGSAASLFASGCRQLNIGIEKANPANADFLGKPVDVGQIKYAVEQIRSGAPGLRLTGTFILGGPNETGESVLGTIQFAIDLDLLFAHFYPLELYPGTEMYKDCFPDDGELDWYKRILADDLPWGELVYESEYLTKTDLLSLAMEGYRLFYGRDQWHSAARMALGSTYPKVANAVQQWCADRFAFQQEDK